MWSEPNWCVSNKETRGLDAAKGMLSICGNQSSISQRIESDMLREVGFTAFCCMQPPAVDRSRA